MSFIHAYYLPTDSASATDELRPVGVERLNALGWKTTFIGGSGDELEKAAQDQAQELGYPVTQEGCTVGLNLELEKNAAMLTPEMTALLTKLQQSASGDLCTTKDTLVIITSGNPYVHIEDVSANAWIHVDAVPGTFILFPAGAKWRLTFDEKTRTVAATAFFKETIHNHGIIPKTEVENHPIRQAYINTQALE
ncbi:hypothetical protein BDP27DRAFT_1476208 [Rhodocollybia butyracea]|uniref:Uncharacterized protein n=1 Tax=Rhodocollybia butyracea TaxID=206335 RepID=A0A9P5U2F0_9AGAR|nr:hypothetical protein BDP27DRAFT_1476208 [Rhodocollybia butyracea]